MRIQLAILFMHFHMKNQRELIVTTMAHRRTNHSVPAISTWMLGILFVVMLTAGCQEKKTALAPSPVDSPVKVRKERYTIVQAEKWEPKDFFQDGEFVQICQAVTARDQTKLEELLKRSPDINAGGKYGFTLLHWAFAERNMEAFRLLLEYGANPDQMLKEDVPCKAYDVSFIEGSNIFFTCIQCLYPQYCVAALPFSDDPNQATIGGNSLLHLVLSRMPCPANKEDIDVMLELGIEVNTQGAYGYTPCHWAVHNAPRLCVTLLEAGADPSIQDDKGEDIADALEWEIAQARRLGRKIEEYEPAIVWLSKNYRKIDDQQPSEIAPSTEGK